MKIYQINQEDLYQLVYEVISHIEKEQAVPKQRYVSKQTCMEVLGITSSTTLQSLRDSQKIEFTYVGEGRRKILYKLSSLYDYLDSKCVKRL